MIQRILGIILLTPVAIGQINSVKPDMSFTDNNDRFDLTGMLSAYNKKFRDTPRVDDDEDEGVASDADYRRQLHSKKMPQLIKKKIDITHTRRDDIDFAYDPDNLPAIGRAENDDMLDLEFQENLNKFKMSIPPASRRNAADADHKHEEEILMQNVVPIVMKVDGYMKPPLQELIRLHAQQGKIVILKTS